MNCHEKIEQDKMALILAYTIQAAVLLTLF